MVLKGVRKVYPAIGPKAKDKIAVKNLSLGIHKKECFGLLGVNGAGKSTTCSMIVGSQLATTGEINVSGIDMRKNRATAQRQIGFCPQYDPIFDLCTGREHLKLYGAIKGIDKAILDDLVQRTLDHLSLTPFADKLAGGYSGGNKRKLCLGMAIIGSPSVVCVDEPTTGVDPISRRFIWEVLIGVAKNASVVLTTHSMEECEALCSRLGIMVDGGFKCLGSAQHLKSRFGSGFQLETTLKIPSSEELDTVLTEIGATGSDQQLDQDAAKAAAQLLGMGEMFEKTFKKDGTAALLLEQLSVGKGTVSAKAIAEWVIHERTFELLLKVLNEHFPGSHMVERQGMRLRFSVSKQDDKNLSDMFRIIEREVRSMVENYSFGQATLETIFNTFAATQSQEMN